MFNWFHPAVPLELNAKHWVEQRLAWLSDQFGYDVFVRRAVILPLEEFFPDPYDGSDETVRVLLDRVCRYMDVEPDRVELELFSNPKDFYLVNEEGHYLPTGAAGTYQMAADRPKIRLDRNGVHRPMELVGTMAHELSHERLLGEGRVNREIFDNELLTDLTVIFHGMGIFSANSPRAWRSKMSVWPNTEVRRPEYLSLPMICYALAHAAWHRGEEKPAWARHMRPDARAAFRNALRYLYKTGNSRFRSR
jgi:hypothetical protein